MSELEATIERLGLKDMFERAERDGLWFWCGYQDLWFSPAELRQSLSNGKFRWGSVNWALRKPREKLDEMRRRAKGADIEAKAFEARLASEPQR